MPACAPPPMPAPSRRSPSPRRRRPPSPSRWPAARPGRGPTPGPPPWRRCWPRSSRTPTGGRRWSPAAPRWPGPVARRPAAAPPWWCCPAGAPEGRAYIRPVTTAPARIRLTQFAHGGGCACKIPPGELEEVVAGLSLGGPRDPAAELVVGLDDGDDAAVVRLPGSSQGLVLTTDFFTPV